MAHPTYGDTEVLRRRVDQLREQAADVRLLADRLVARTESIAWTGRAAESMRQRVTERARALRDAAHRHDTAAAALDSHVQAVERTAEAIAARERRATSLIGDARGRLAEIESLPVSGVRRQPDPDDVALASFTPPASGHRDWLDVELPGL